MSRAAKIVQRQAMWQRLFKRLRPLWLSLGALFIFAGLLHLTGFTINGSASMPHHFYRNAYGKISIGDTVSVCLPKAVTQSGLKQGYIYSSAHQCPNGSVHVIKEVIALPGDRVVLDENKMCVTHANQTHCYIAPIFAFGPETGKPIKQFVTLGSYANTSGYWLYGKGSPQYSWDSRYYGPVKRWAIGHKLRPIFHQRRKAVPAESAA